VEIARLRGLAFHRGDCRDLGAIGVAEDDNLSPRRNT
jgi:hypothetical protein